MKKYIFALALFLCVSAEQNVDSPMKTISNFVEAIETTQLDPSTLANIGEGEDIIKERCLKNGNNESYELAMEAKGSFQNCVKGLVDIEKIQDEIDKARPTGDLDLVFKKYCKKSPALRDCIANYTKAIEPCLAENEKSTSDTVLNITDSMINFICFKEGDRIALFIAEGGPECLMSKGAVIQDCLNQTYYKYKPEDEEDALNKVSIQLDEEQCKNVNEVQKCVVRELEKCEEPTPANIIDSMFNFVRKSTPCKKYDPRSLGLDGSTDFAPRSATSALLLLTTAVALVLSAS